jgi:phosphoribosylanthranilate isomerase
MADSLWIKICGITSVADATMVTKLGADALGLNFIPRSKRRVEVDAARAIVQAVGGQIECIGLVEDLEEAAIRELVATVGLNRVQLHGREPAELVTSLGDLAFKAIGIMSAKDVKTARKMPGRLILVDACVNGKVGGTGSTFDWRLLGELVKERHVVLAGGLHPDNVASAVRSVRPFGIDVASGVEQKGRPGHKDERLVESFIREARAAQLGP